MVSISPFRRPAFLIYHHRHRHHRHRRPILITHHPKMWVYAIAMAFLLPCAGMGVVFLIYFGLVWYASRNRQPDGTLGTAAAAEKGLSASELEKLPKVMGKELVKGNECAVCLEEIDGEEEARMVPCCSHGFHLQCADTWLLIHSACPVCRTNLDDGDLFFNASADHDSPC